MKTRKIILTVTGTVVITFLLSCFLHKLHFHKRYKNRFTRIENKLELSKEQSEKVKDLIIKYLPKAAEIKLKEDNILIQEEKLMSLHEEAKMEVRQILSSEQFEKLEKKMKRHCY